MAAIVLKIKDNSSVKLADNLICAKELTLSTWQASILPSLLFARRPSGERAEWLLEDGGEWAHDCSSFLVFLSICLTLLWGQSAVASSIISSGSYSDSTSLPYCRLFSSFTLQFSPCLAVNLQILFSIPTPSLIAWLVHHANIFINVLSACGCGGSSAHRQGLSVWLCVSSHGSFLL